MEALSIVLHKLRYSQRIRWARFPVGAASTDECGYRPILIGFNGLPLPIVSRSEPAVAAQDDRWSCSIAGLREPRCGSHGH